MLMRSETEKTNLLLNVHHSLRRKAWYYLIENWNREHVTHPSECYFFRLQASSRTIHTRMERLVIKASAQELDRPCHLRAAFAKGEATFAACANRSPCSWPEEKTVHSSVLQSQMVRFPRLLRNALLVDPGLHRLTSSLWDDRDKKLALTT